MTKLANEYRETMDKDVLHSWAKDAVEEIRRLEAENKAHEAFIASIKQLIEEENK